MSGTSEMTGTSISPKIAVVESSPSVMPAAVLPQPLLARVISPGTSLISSSRYWKPIAPSTSPAGRSKSGPETVPSMLHCVYSVLPVSVPNKNARSSGVSTPLLKSGSSHRGSIHGTPRTEVVWPTQEPFWNQLEVTESSKI